MDRQLLRQRLLGKEGPYADPREAIDAMDNVSLWIRTLGREERSEASKVFLSLLLDEDISVATGAALAIGQCLDPCGETHFLTQWMDALRNGSPSWLRKPEGFAAASHKTLLEESFARIVQFASVEQMPNVEDTFLYTSVPSLRSRLLVLMGARFAPLVVYHAHQFLLHEDCLAIPHLPKHWERVAVAGALRPWPRECVDRVTRVLNLKSVHPNDIQAIQRVMLDEYPELTRPANFHEDGFWWILACDPYRWTVWEAKNGRLALETVLPGMAQSTTTRILSPTESMRFRQTKMIDNIDKP